MHFLCTLPPSKQWEIISLSQVFLIHPQETVQKGSIILGQIYKPSSSKLQSYTKPCHSRNTIFSSLWRTPNPALTPTSGTDAIIPRRSRIWLTHPGAHCLALAIAKKTLDENCFRTAEKTTDIGQRSFKIGNRVYFKNKQLGKQDPKWTPGYRIVHIECDGYYLHIKNQSTGKTRSCSIKDVVLKPPVELWNIDM